MDGKFKAEVDTLVTFLSMVNEDCGPKDVRSFSTPFLEEVVRISRNFYQLRVKNDDAKTTGVFANKVLMGADAAKSDMARFRDALQSEGQDLGLFVGRLRKFQWLLTPEEQTEIEEAVKDRLKRRRTELMAPLAITNTQDNDVYHNTRKAAAASSKDCPDSIVDGSVLEPLGLGSRSGGLAPLAGPSGAGGGGADTSKEDTKKLLSALFKTKA